MESVSIWALITVTLLIICGIVGTLLPVIPGSLLVWFGILIFKLWQPDAISWIVVFGCGILALLAQLLDLVCSYYGAKRFGAGWRGGVGAVLGAIIGPFLLAPIFTPLGGLIVGPVLGAVLGELIGGRTLKESGKAGFGTIVGGVVASLLKLILTLIMAGWFFIDLWSK